MAQPSITPELNPDSDLTTRRIQVFLEHYGDQALDLACHAAFPLVLTSDLVYCLRENFVPECPWYYGADLLLSSLCDTVGHDLYEMEGATRNALLQRLKQNRGPQRLNDLQNFMVEYIQHRLQSDRHTRVRMMGDRPHWTALACLEPGKAYDQIQQELKSLVETTADPKDRFHLAALVASHADLLPNHRPFLLEWAQDAADGKPIRDLTASAAQAAKAAKAAGFPLQPLDSNLTTVTWEEEADPGDTLRSYTVTTVIVDDRGKQLATPQHDVYSYTESLGPEAPGIEMMAIRGGQFMMGSPSDEEGRDGDEGPQHLVTVPPFFLGKYPVTQAQWRAMTAQPKVNIDLNPDPSNFKGENRPVEKISWEDAVEYCARLSQFAGRDYRLPTEAEWEYACRAATTTPYHFGETITTELANYDGNSTYRSAPKGKYREHTTDVGSFPPNAFGLHDMHGNVYDWCQDHWHDNYEGAPTDGSAWIEPDDNDNRYRVRRGGSWILNPRICRAAYRFDFNPRDRYNDNGLRLSCSLPRTP